MQTFLSIAEFVFMFPVAIIIALIDAVWGMPTGYQSESNDFPFQSCGK